ncbi:MAG: FlgB family protein [Paracoccaceae bacterium]|nr:FlgB family protein [Paracoccaceae bacterium]
MLDAPYLMKMAQSLARHAGARQAQIAKNIANADVPGYRARDLVDFAETFRRSDKSADIRTTRAGHMTADVARGRFGTFDIGGQAAPNGNTVSDEQEMARSTDAKSSHDLALTVYKSSLDILKTSIGRGR